MKVNSWKYILLSLSVLFAGCREDIAGPADADGEEPVVLLEVSSGKPSAKAKEDSGDYIYSLDFWLTDTDGKVVLLGSDTPALRAKASVIVADDGKSAKARITNLKRGVYRLYLVANLPGNLQGTFHKYDVGGTLGEDFLDATLPQLDGVSTVTPPFGDDYAAQGRQYMPLTLVKEISVNAGENRVSAELHRACGRIRVTIVNATMGYDLFLNKVSLSDESQSTGYLFEHDHAVPDFSYEVPFKSYDSGSEVTRKVKYMESEIYLQQYVYESGKNNMDGMVLSLRGGLFKSGTQDKVKVVQESHSTYSDGAVVDVPSQDTDYLVRSKGSMYYLYEDNGVLRGRTRPNIELLMVQDDFKDYLWNFRNVKTSTADSSWIDFNMQNYASDRYVAAKTTLEVEMSDTPYTMTASTGWEASRIFYASEHKHSTGSITYDRYQLYTRRSSDEKIYCRDGVPPGYYEWEYVPIYYFQGTTTKLTDLDGNKADKDVDINVSNIKVINSYGEAVNIENLCRNEELDIKVYVHYAPETGLVYFEVKAWDTIQNETTFD